MTKFLEKLQKVRLTPDTYKILPQVAGIYLFFLNKTPIYIGKAINIKRRVSSYFDLHLEPKTAMMMHEANYLSFIKVTSELEALLLEAKLIRKFKPRYNIVSKDDKHPLYIAITKEEFPRVLTVRKPTTENRQPKSVYGPFPFSANVKQVLKMLRKIFPYSDHKLGKRGCLYSHIGLCDPCPSEIVKIKNEELRTAERKKYLRNLKYLKSILSGRFAGVRKQLQKEMETYSKEQKYETAAEVRNKIKRLDFITQPQIPSEYFIENPNLYEDIRDRELKELLKILNSKFLILNSIRRIECYDVAHLAGTNPTASMVTFVDGEADKKFYRHFKIHQKKKNSDVDSLREVIKRRIKHLESPTSLKLRGVNWGRPDLIIVDGGKAQVGVFLKELENYQIPVVGLAKRFETLVIPVRQKVSKVSAVWKLSEVRLSKGQALNLIQRIRDEAHRFARRLHHKQISRQITSGYS